MLSTSLLSPHPNWNASTLPGPTALHTALHLDNKHYHRLHSEQLIAAAHQRLNLIRSGQDPDADPRWQQPRWNVSCKLEDDEGHPMKADGRWELNSRKHGAEAEQPHLSLLEREVRWEEEKRREIAEREERERKQEERRAAWREWDRKEQWNADVSPIIALPSADRRQQATAAAAAAAAQSSVDNKEALLNHLRNSATFVPAAASPSLPSSSSASSSSLQPRPYYLYSHPGHYGWREDESGKCWSCCQSSVETARGCVVVANSQRKVRLVPVTQSRGRAAAEERQLGVVVRYEHEGVWESSRTEEAVWQWSCCGMEEKDGRGCIARPLVREQRWNIE